MKTKNNNSERKQNFKLAKYSKKDMSNISVWLEKESYNKLTNFCISHNITISDLIRQSLSGELGIDIK